MLCACVRGKARGGEFGVGLSLRWERSVREFHTRRTERQENHEPGRGPRSGFNGLPQQRGTVTESWSACARPPVSRGGPGAHRAQVGTSAPRAAAERGVNARLSVCRVHLDGARWSCSWTGQSRGQPRGAAAAAPAAVPRPQAAIRWADLRRNLCRVNAHRRILSKLSSRGKLRLKNESFNTGGRCKSLPLQVIYFLGP